MTDTIKSWYLEIDATVFYKLKLPEVQINLHFGKFELVIKSSMPNYGWSRISKCIFDSDRRFEFAELDVSEFDLSRFDCIITTFFAT